MTRVLTSILHLTSLLLILQFYAPSSNAQVTDEQVKQDLMKLEHALYIGIKTHDTTALKNIVASEYQLTGPKFSEPVPRQYWLINCFEWSFDSATLAHISLLNWGEVAVLRSLHHLYNLVIGDQPNPFIETWVTDLWMKRDGRWQLVTRLSERLPKK